MKQDMLALRKIPHRKLSSRKRMINQEKKQEHYLTMAGSWYRLF